MPSSFRPEWAERILELMTEPHWTMSWVQKIVRGHVTEEAFNTEMNALFVKLHLLDPQSVIPAYHLLNNIRGNVSNTSITQRHLRLLFVTSMVCHFFYHRWTASIKPRLLFSQAMHPYSNSLFVDKINVTCCDYTTSRISQHICCQSNYFLNPKIAQES